MDENLVRVLPIIHMSPIFFTQSTIYSATTFLEKCRKVVLEKWFCKLGFFFWSTTFLEPEKRWIYTIKPPFFSGQPLFSNHFSRTRFLEPDFYKQQKLRSQNKWSTGNDMAAHAFWAVFSSLFIQKRCVIFYVTQRTKHL